MALSSILRPKSDECPPRDSKSHIIDRNMVIRIIVGGLIFFIVMTLIGGCSGTRISLLLGIC